MRRAKYWLGERRFRTGSRTLRRGPDILVNNAGIAESELFIKSDELMWERHLNTNLGGTFRCTHAALPEMVERGWAELLISLRLPARRARLMSLLTLRQSTVYWD